MPLPNAIFPAALIDFIRTREAGLPEPMSCERREFAAACAVLRTWLGQQWVRKRISGHPYLNPQGVGLPTDKFKRQARIVQLANQLLNMQHLEGIEHLLPRLRKGSLKADIAELEGASILFGAGISFKFVKRTNTKGLDYDVEATVNGVKVCCEMKSKLDTTAPSAQSFLKSLKKARNQVPSDTPNVLFIKTPEAWMLTEQGYTAIKDGLAKFFEESDHYSCVVVHAEEWRTYGENGAVVSQRAFVYPNPNARVKLPIGDQNPIKWLEFDPRRYLHIEEIVCGPKRRELMNQARSAIEAKIREGR